MKSVRTRGRPPIKSDEEILRTALRAFAARGFDATSVRALNAELGLSHETISQRFGSKQSLYFAAVETGVADFNATFAEALSIWPADIKGLEELRAVLHSFITAASQHPEIGSLVNHEGGEQGDRFDRLLTTVLRPGVAAFADLLQRLINSGAIRPVTAREVFFLAQAGAAPFHFQQLSAAFDSADGDLDRETHITSATETIVEGIRQR